VLNLQPSGRGGGVTPNEVIGFSSFFVPRIAAPPLNSAKATCVSEVDEDRSTLASILRIPSIQQNT